MADNLTTFMCLLSRNLGASTFWNPQGLSRPVMGLLLELSNHTTLSPTNASRHLAYNILLVTPTGFDPSWHHHQGFISK
jgi:hypothetical protein